MTTKQQGPSEGPGSTPGISPFAFDFFPKLPTELRLKIWQHVLDLEPPCIVEVEYRGSMVCQSTSSRPLPALLSTTRESRKETLRIYKPCFSVVHNKPPQIYFNFDKDTLYVGSRCIEDLRHLLEACKEEDRVRIRRLAFDPLSHWEEFLANEENHDVAAVLQRDLPGLEQLVLVKEAQYIDYVEGYDIAGDDYPEGFQFDEESFRERERLARLAYGKTPQELRNAYFFQPKSRVIHGQDLYFDANVAEEIMENGKKDHPDWKLPRIRVLGIWRGKGDEDSENWEDWEEQKDEFDPDDAWVEIGDGIWEGEWEEYDTEEAFEAVDGEEDEEVDEDVDEDGGESGNEAPGEGEDEDEDEA